MDGSPLEAEIRRRIRLAGPMPVRQFMTLCLTHPEHGYYMTRDPFGRTGDFITAPEVSQVFGELVGLWAAAVWAQMGRPEHVHFVELGPGRGTMMRDALRAAQVVPAFRSALVIHLIEISPILQKRQQQTLAGIDVPMTWHQSFNEVPHGPTIILANEFFDALPIHQAIKNLNGWYERLIDVDNGGNFVFTAADDRIPLFEQLLPLRMRDAEIGSLYEWRVDQLALELSHRVVRSGGAGLVIDYGHVRSATGETLQAVGGHVFANPLVDVGTVDLTAHVDFESLGQSFESMTARVHGPVEQGLFLRQLGIERRAKALKAYAPREKAVEIDDAVARLIGDSPAGMGQLFKAMAFSPPDLKTLPGFDVKLP